MWEVAYERRLLHSAGPAERGVPSRPPPSHAPVPAVGTGVPLGEHTGGEDAGGKVGRQVVTSAAAAARGTLGDGLGAEAAVVERHLASEGGRVVLLLLLLLLLLLCVLRNRRRRGSAINSVLVKSTGGVAPGSVANSRRRRRCRSRGRAAAAEMLLSLMNGETVQFLSQLAAAAVFGRGGRGGCSFLRGGLGQLELGFSQLFWWRWRRGQL